MEASDISRYPSVNPIDLESVHLHMTATQVVLSPHKCHGCPCIRHTVASPWAIANGRKATKARKERAQDSALRNIAKERTTLSFLGGRAR